MINTKEIATDASNAIQMESKTNEIACNLPDTRPAHFFFQKFIRTNCGEHKLKSCMKYIVPLPQKIMSKLRYKTALVYDFDMNYPIGNFNMKISNGLIIRIDFLC